MSAWPAVKAQRVLAALLRIGWVVTREESSHKTLARAEVARRGIRDLLAPIAGGEARVEDAIEDAIAEGLPFQRPSAFLSHFAALDPKLDLASALKKPYNRRKQRLLDSLEQMVEMRHELIHRSNIVGDLSDAAITRIMRDVKESVERCYRRLCEHRGWLYCRRLTNQPPNEALSWQSGPSMMPGAVQLVPHCSLTGALDSPRQSSNSRG